jgi:hypothetical protein
MAGALGRRGPGRLSACPIFRYVISAAATVPSSLTASWDTDGR